MRIFILLAVLMIISVSSGIRASDKYSSVEVILSSDNSIYEQSLYGIQSVIEREVNIRYLDIIATENLSIENYFQDLESSGIPLVITIGPQATKAAKDNLNKTPIVFSMVNNPKTLGLEQKNLCGVSMDVSTEEFFQTLVDINPKIRRIVGFYSNEDSKFSAEEGAFLDLRYKLLYTPYMIKPIEFESKLEEIKETTDAFFMISDPLYNQSRFETLSSFAKKNGIILMTSFPTLVKVGATFAISPEYSKIGVETGLMANRILNGNSNCLQERVLLPSQSAFYLNEEYARDSGIKLPEQILERARLTKLFAAGIALLNEDKLTSSRKVFETILKKDPDNKAAQTYLSLVIEKMTGTRTRELLANASRFYESQQYAQARSEYQKVLSINPNNEIAKEGYKKSILAQSEQERARGNSFARSGKPFDAIRSYLNSLRTLSSNQRASADLAAIRRQESAKIPDYLKTGITEYNDRNYDRSIEIFENILLIDPNEKSAKEYLRLSYKKKEAIEILINKLRN
jgi:ABC-type uncharacterized transport system substrate-binding protein